MRVLLVNPPIIELSRRGADYTPIGLLKIGSWLRAEGHDVRLLQCERFHNVDQTMVSETEQDGRITWHIADIVRGAGTDAALHMPVFYHGLEPSRILDAIRTAAPDEVWITTGLTTCALGVNLLTDLIQRHLQLKVRVGGIGAILEPRYYARAGVDDVHGGLVPDAERFLWDFSLMNYDPGCVTLKLHSGCQVSPPCVFCSVQRIEPRLVLGDYDMIFSFVASMAEQGHRHFRIWSSQFLVSKHHARTVLGRLIDLHRQYGITFDAAEGVEPWLLDDEVLGMMKAAGFTRINMSLEASSEALRREWNKPFSGASTVVAIERAVALGLRTRVYLMCGVPGQAPETFERDLKKLVALGVTARPNIYGPVPGSALWERDIGSSLPHPLLTSGYAWPGVDDLDAVRRYEQIMARYLDASWMGFRSTEGASDPPSAAADLFGGLHWPENTTLRQ